ncbi:MAG: GGDEF domain-containing protein [Aeoliella sp.]
MSPSMLALADWGIGGAYGIPETAALASIALIGYMFGRRSRPQVTALPSVAPKELHRAARIARQLEDTIDVLRHSLAEHRSHIARFQTKVGEAADRESQEVLPLLSEEAEIVIAPTLRLAMQLSHAYDELRQQSQALANFTEGRTDPLTGLGNTISLEEQIELLLADSGGPAASIALVSVELPEDAIPASDAHRDFIKSIAGEIELCVRENDYLARLGGAEFAILMPKTLLAGARIFGTRLRVRLQDQLEMLVSCGLSESVPEDTPQSLLSRADSALYSARAEGRGSQFLHTGNGIQAETATPLPDERTLQLAGEAEV